ncbi:TIGR01777 family oxidoreductase [Actinomycetaceae bacterium MB13-C1-2]|nr:TIGR01777 family oxidoreductase [Actinomycetaceae bacterium MB13-C1-2]
MVASTIIVSGASGLIGTALVKSLRSDGATVKTLVRHPPLTTDEIEWNPDRGEISSAELAGAQAVVNLNGASIGKLPWTKQYRQTLRTSRIRPTRILATAIRDLGDEAPALISASAVGFYGDRPDEILTEDSRPGRTFLAKLCVEWEKAAVAASPYTRVALLRTAPVLDLDGVLKPMITLTKLGLGGPLGKGTQIWPWISLEDEIRAIKHVIASDIEGPVNLSGPTRASENDIGRTIAKTLKRPYWFKTPGPLIRAVLGRDPADSLLLSDADVRPAVLKNTGFEFQYETPRAAIEESLRRA